MSAITRSQIAQRLQDHLKPHVLDVIDESAAHAGHAGADSDLAGTHFRVRVASGAFAGKTRVAQHRLVYDSLHDLMASGIHALAIEIVPSGTD